MENSNELQEREAKILSVDSLLSMSLEIPDYQRPYKWEIKNIEDLFLDINNAINDRTVYGEEFKYRIGTILLHKRKKNEKDTTNDIDEHSGTTDTSDKNGVVYDIVDGQQRIISLVLIKCCIELGFECSILKKKFASKITQYNIHRNYKFIKEWFALNKDKEEKFKEAFDKILEVIVISVDKESEAFQLFDSQNTRGKELYPHDLLKAYHLREMKKYPYEMEHAVTKWEAKDTDNIKDLFSLYLFPIWNWSRGNKSRPFTSKEIDTYKGVVEGSTYTYARRASKASPYFQITEPFIAGNDFFEMVDHYMYLFRDIKSEICTNEKFQKIKETLCDDKDAKTIDEMDNVKNLSTGFKYTKNLFYCALLCYYDKFHNFDEMAVKKLFIWAFMLRVDMDSLGFDSVNKYAIGEESSSKNGYSNNIGMFSKINLARRHYEISSLQLNIEKMDEKKATEERKNLYKRLKELNEGK